MDFGEVLDGALTLYRRNFALFIKLSLAVMWAPVALLVFLQLRFLAGFQAAARVGNPQAILTLWQDQFGAIVLWGLLWVVLYTAASLLLTAGTIRVISDNYLGRDPSFQEAFTQGVGKIVPLFLVELGKSILLFIIIVISSVVIGVIAGLSGAMGLAGAILFISLAVVGAFWLAAYVWSAYGLTTPVIVLESLQSSFDSFGRSWELTTAARLRMFGWIAVAWLLASFLPYLVFRAVGFMIKDLGQTVLLGWLMVQSVFTIFLIPIRPCVRTLAYYDLRVRREAFDLELLGKELGVG
jgi:hypothetical protein